MRHAGSKPARIQQDGIPFKHEVLGTYMCAKRAAEQMMRYEIPKKIRNIPFVRHRYA